MKKSGCQKRQPLCVMFYSKYKQLFTPIFVSKMDSSFQMIMQIYDLYLVNFRKITIFTSTPYSILAYSKFNNISSANRAGRAIFINVIHSHIYCKKCFFSTDDYHMKLHYSQTYVIQILKILLVTKITLKKFLL